jgi:hypothetical protein
MELGIYFFLGAGVYFLPSWIGTNKRNSTSIFLLNLLLGWSIIGWIVALVWATTKEGEPIPLMTQAPPAPPIQPAAPLGLPADPDTRAVRLKDLRNQGVITQEEFLRLIG